jgi:hypothetical protein
MPSSEQYRERAARVRQRAEEVTDPELRRQLDLVAQDYDELARSAASGASRRDDTSAASLRAN